MYSFVPQLLHTSCCHSNATATLPYALASSEIWASHAVNSAGDTLRTRSVPFRRKCPHPRPLYLHPGTPKPDITRYPKLRSTAEKMQAYMVDATVLGQLGLARKAHSTSLTLLASATSMTI